MKKIASAKNKKAVKKVAKNAASTARTVAGNAYVVGRGIFQGAKQGIKDAQKFGKRGKKKS